MKSPIVEVVVGTSEARTTYSAHEAVLVKSPELAKQIENFEPRGVCPSLAYILEPVTDPL